MADPHIVRHVVFYVLYALIGLGVTIVFWMLKRHWANMERGRADIIAQIRARVEAGKNAPRR
ncbi:MAG: hypothetical protein RLZZ324_490 [Candidatus Parcubacteria bacterium]|jgi:hypothetical protein